MKNLIWIFIIATVCLFSCGRKQADYNSVIDNAESVISVNPDSALSMLDAIEPAELTVDSIKAKYYYAMALAHDKKGNLMLSDSLINYSAEFYRDKDLKRSIMSATLLAAYKYRIGEREMALSMLDSLSSLKNVPDSLLIGPLRGRVGLGVYDGPNESFIKRLMTIDKDENWLPQYKYWLYFDFLFSGKNDSALVILDELIDVAAHEGVPELKFRYEYEKIGALEELGRYSESMDLADKLMNEPQGSIRKQYFHLWKSLAMLNMGNKAGASKELAKADSFALASPKDEREYFNSFAYILSISLDYHNTGKLNLIRMAQINNSLKDYLLRSKSLQHETEQSILEVENRRLMLKARNDRQTAMLIIVVLAALLISGGLLWYAVNRKRKALELLERNETLQKLVDESNTTETNATQNETLRRAMLQQLGIIKMVAETPTEQNRDMLRKISSIDSDTNGSLVNWDSVYEIIDNLYSGFYSKINERHGDALTDKEQQIIALMVAGFSTKEISVITAQTTATIYVRKSSIRKKLGIPEKEDIVAFLRHEVQD